LRHGQGVRRFYRSVKNQPVYNPAMSTTPVRESREQFVLVFGTSHQLQGGHFKQPIDDDTYRDFVRELIHGQQIDFVFEEGSGHQPTHASKFAEAQIPPIDYLDIDPARAERKKYGLAEDTGSVEPIDLFSQPPEFSYWEKPAEHVKRERFWLQKIKATKFRRALVICGYFHIQSFSARLLDEGFEVESVYYMPHHKLCTRRHW
jgi:hypothetical protein